MLGSSAVSRPSLFIAIGEGDDDGVDVGICACASTCRCKFDPAQECPPYVLTVGERAAQGKAPGVHRRAKRDGLLDVRFNVPGD